jgi:hypothetical protein
MATLRTPETKKKYSEWLAQHAPQDGCPLCIREPLHSFKLWKIIDNHFPYDRVAKVHHTLVPLRHVAEVDLSAEERAELLEIKRGKLVDDTYDYSLEATPHTLSIPDHFHIHLMAIKDFE